MLIEISCKDHLVNALFCLYVFGEQSIICVISCAAGQYSDQF